MISLTNDKVGWIADRYEVVPTAVVLSRKDMGPSGHFWFSQPTCTGEECAPADAESDTARQVGKKSEQG